MQFHHALHVCGTNKPSSDGKTVSNQKYFLLNRVAYLSEKKGGINCRQSFNLWLLMENPRISKLIRVNHMEQKRSYSESEVLFFHWSIKNRKWSGKSFWARLPKVKYGVRRRQSWNWYFCLNLLESLFRGGALFVPYVNKQKISPFYRTSSPIGAAAQKGPRLGKVIPVD